MIHGYKPAFYFEKGVGSDGKTVQGEGRQCIHCQFCWEYVPGSGRPYGYCITCGGFICARPECHAQQQRWIADWEGRTGKIRTCIPFDEWNGRMIEKIAHLLPLAEDVTVTPEGIIIPKY